MIERRPAIAAALFAIASVPAAAEPAKPDTARLITPEVIADIRSFIDTEVVKLSILTQNKRHAAMDQGKIDALDEQWKTERESAEKPLISATLSNPLSTYLARIQGRSLGLYAEIFVMDKNGLNVGQSSITSDFWQGDEAKFQKTHDVGVDAMFIDEPEWDADNGIWRGQVSLAIADEAKSSAIGAATVEINLTELERRAALGS